MNTRAVAFASRNFKELIRDLMNLGFGIAFPVLILLLLTLIQSNIPVEMFTIDKLAPGIAVFGLAFIALFSGMLIARDRTTSFMMRLYTSPLTSSEIILGYMLPLIPMAMLQMIVCYIVSFALGLTPSFNVLAALVLQIPAALLFISIGLLCGSLLTDKQVGGICGALLTNLCAWLSGIWFDIEMLGGTIKKVAGLLPFVHAVDLGKKTIAGNYADILPDLLWVSGYAVVTTVAAIIVFNWKMSRNNT